MNGLFYQAITDSRMKGVYLATAPNPVSNSELMYQLKKALKAPFALPSPSFLVKFGAKFFLDTDPDLALSGRYCRSKRLEEEGFDFKFPEIESALREIYE